MPLHNYVRKYGKCDRQFEKMKDTTRKKNNEDLDFAGEEEEEYRTPIGPRSQAMSKLRDDIAASLMGARN